MSETRPIAAIELGERTARQLPVTPDERRWPECPKCGGELIHIIEHMVCADCSAVMGGAE